jgi:hypothetical protein
MTVYFDELATYRVRPEVDYRTDSHEGDYAVPSFEIVHSICNQVVSNHDVSVSLIEMVQRALSHNKECK